MYTSLVMNVINIGGNAILIYGAGIGVMGAALATLIARMVSALVMVVLLSKKIIRSASRHQDACIHRKM